MNPRVPTTMDLPGRDLVGLYRPCTQRNPERRAFLCSGAAERKLGVKRMHGKNPINMENGKKALGYNLTFEVNRPSRRPDTEQRQEITDTK